MKCTKCNQNLPKPDVSKRIYEILINWDEGCYFDGVPQFKLLNRSLDKAVGEIMSIIEKERMDVAKNGVEVLC